ncbi:hypothetical protein EXIGLDRAFT_733411 [Exidia glandulosa HHB12029]|uniref:F-box domain-containing protein n=1 Tax=Exidia glandulosa HHB12029 TaxID=1314781 RepID=A0A165BAU4_EXIGL|nr:hypothetical protein EXIGLDRAFT_733411 [Exidia glandulosa HHB12029]
MERELSSLVLSVFQKTLALAGPTTHDIITQTVAAVQRCVTATLAPELRIYNARLASTACLPDEVLCMIWELLCVADRVEVSHVCSSWRSLAINTPRLWAELDFYSAVHNDPCYCSLCTPHMGVTSVQLWNPPSVTNLGICRNVLARSGCVPLIVHMEFSLDDTPIREIRRITASLELHSHRIKSLSFIAQLPDDVADFFNEISGLSALPNLRSLHCLAKDTSPRQQQSIILPTLPSVETMIIRMSSLDCTALRLPSLRRLHCPVVDENDVRGILDGCPKLETLILDTKLFRPTSLSDTTLKSICSRASRLREVVLLDVDRALEATFLAMFHNADLPRLWIRYDDQHPAPARGFIIFYDMEESIDLGLVVSEEAGAEYRISATDSSGRCRTVQCLLSSDTMLAMWGSLSLGSVTTLTLPAHSWSSTIQPDIPILPCVRSATFLFDERTEYLLIRVWDRPYPLPGLEHLRIACSKDLPDRPLVSVAAVAILVTSLRGFTPVDTLTVTVNNVELDGDQEGLVSLVRQVQTSPDGFQPQIILEHSCRRNTKLSYFSAT